MEPGIEVVKACEKYVQTLFAAKETAETAEAFWENKRANKAWQRLFEAIAKYTKPDLKWGMVIGELAAGISDSVWEGQLEEQVVSKRLYKVIVDTLEDLEYAPWIVCVPLERLFQAFPEFTDFGAFALVNPVRETGLCHDDLLQRFREILARNMAVNFMASPEVTDSYLQLGEHYLNKSGHYIPGRPQLVLKIGRGERLGNEWMVQELIPSYHALLCLCQLVYGTGGGLRTFPADIRLPSGEVMPFGFLEIPEVAVAINSRSGQCAWWLTRLRTYETAEDEPYDPERFKKIWEEVAAPIIRLRSAGLSGPLRYAIDNAIKLVARCRHGEMGDLTLYSVIATETILNPFNARGDTSERFALFAAVLTETTPEKRLEAYNGAKSLYNLRNYSVHQSRPHGRDNANEFRRQAFKLFLTCLKSVTRWATTTLAQDGVCGPDEFKNLYLNQVFS